ncbi:MULTISPECIES: hypothetical protein [Gordonia]|uniref:hypothetical protein n=1 Tax=Gordonia TaxID=2053 RepID=UPI000348BAB3|nr:MULTISPECIES: hypothetical protein [Gordonia]
MGVRLDDAAADQIDALATRFDLTAAATVRAIVVGALADHTPPEWFTSERDRIRHTLADRGRRVAAHRWKDRT